MVDHIGRAPVDFAESAEHQALRKTVADITGRFGGAYYARHAEAHEPCDELWSALGEAGFIGINVPEEYGGGGAGARGLGAAFGGAAGARAAPAVLLGSPAVLAGVVWRLRWGG